MNMINSIIFLILAFLSSLSYVYSATSGPFVITLEETGKCPDLGTDELTCSNHKVVKLSKTKYDLSLDCESKHVVDDSLDLVVDIAIFDNGRWKEHYFKQENKKICSVAKKVFGSMEPIIGKGTNYTDCPLPAGFSAPLYIPLSDAMSKSAVQQFPYGKYKVEVQFFQEETKIGCLYLIGEAKPKKKSKKSN